MSQSPRSSDAALPENLKENLDRKLDHAIQETFPTSDPVSVTITKGVAIEYDEHGQAIGDESKGSPAKGQSTVEDLMNQAKEHVSGLAGTASDLAGNVYDRGRRYAREAVDHYPDALRQSREGMESARRYASDNPVLTALAGFAFGYALAWVLHRSTYEDDHVPDYARLEHRYRRSQR